MNSPEVKLIIWGTILDALNSPGMASDPSPVITKLSGVTLENAFDTICTSLRDLGLPLEIEGLVEPFKAVTPHFDSHDTNWPLHAIRCALLIKLAPTHNDSSSTENHSSLLTAILWEFVRVCDKLKEQDTVPGATFFHQIVKKCLSLLFTMPFWADPLVPSWFYRNCSCTP